MLDVQTDGPKIRKQNNLKVQLEGEVITSGEFVDLFEEKKANKKAEKKQKAKRDNRKEGEISLNIRIAKMHMLKKVITSNTQ